MLDICFVLLHGICLSASACLANNVRALVFTSTVNVVFGGQRIESGDESLPYFDFKQVIILFEATAKGCTHRFILTKYIT